MKPVDEPATITGARYYCERCGLVTAPTRFPAGQIRHQCAAAKRQWGIGSVLKAALALAGFRACGGCLRRAETLDRWTIAATNYMWEFMKRLCYVDPL